ncbi:D-2-hydroxyacid dehydrogenase [Bifidobacterium vansinderenii]|uniref:2-hydroxyacid dehydrogenase n=1 Tax=Bifidobacterium vansinderenii TaxID=1984871 RepID=A0A229VVD9_9BIFI|nr:D-2-hydroxyacid dehydrogenase [Bifidobacterium vansinderenii]OXM99580.1 2-hydroxyacid dehydrogenase [Bifidobacterium vansinderenii]
MTIATTRDDVIVNCLPLSDDERRAFVEAANGVEQVFVGDPAERDAMSWSIRVPDELRERATVIIGNVPAAQMAQYPNLKWLQTWSAGVDAYLAPGVLDPSVVVTNASGAYGQSVSEHLFAMMWALMKNLPQYRDSQQRNEWRDAGAVISPSDATVLVIGTGDIGSHFATMCRGVGARTMGARRNPNKTAKGIDSMHGFDELDELLPQADVVALIVPSTPDTHHLLDGRRLALLKPGAIVLNAGRGDAIDPDALLANLDRLRGAGLDVTEPEPLPSDSPLWSHPRCLITPHVAGGNHLSATVDRIIAIARDNVANYTTGVPLRNMVRR